MRGGKVADPVGLPAERGVVEERVLEQLDTALLDLRRFTEAPRDRPARYAADGERRVGMSTVLVVHAVASVPPGRCDIGTVATVLHVAHSTASRLVERAGQAGMITRDRAEDDPRRTALTLTDAGRRLNAEAVRFRTRHLHTVLTGWTAEDVSTLTRLLERFAVSAATTRDEEPR